MSLIPHSSLSQSLNSSLVHSTFGIFCSMLFLYHARLFAPPGRLPETVNNYRLKLEFC
uniref:Uncharacterized protein n=1 Tax=Anopheles minimus TaxID=112268 RepID=A0A182WP47_9DIPT